MAPVRAHAAPGLRGPAETGTGTLPSPTRHSEQAPLPAQPATRAPMARPVADLPPESLAAAQRIAPMPPRVMSAQALHSFDRGSVERPAVMLTFDAGSHSTGAAEILDALAAEGVRTTFFLTGEFIRDHPDLVLRIAAEGHEVGNHTETHLHLTQWEEKRRHTTRPEVDRERLLAELQHTQDAFKALTGKPMAPLWRAPYGEHNQDILRWAADAGWAHVGWTPSMDTLDWVTDTRSHLYRDADEIARRLLALPDRDAHGGHGAIVLMHLGSERPAQEQLGRILPLVLADYRSRGLKILTASAMMQGS